jgi:RHS repeat-associated protein
MLGWDRRVSRASSTFSRLTKSICGESQATRRSGVSYVRLVVACLVSSGLIAVAFAGSAPAEEASAPVVEEAPSGGQVGTTSETDTSPPPAPEEKSAGETTEPSPSSFPLEGPLVTPGSPTEAEEQRAAEEARLASPEAVQAREESEFAYSGLSSTESKELAATTFPTLVDEPNGGAPKLPEGAHITSFSSEFAAAVDLPGGERGTVESVAPIAVNTPSGTVPVDLTPQQAGSGFEANTPAEGMHVRAGGKLSEGASLSDLGITLTPVTEDGTPLEGSRSVDGASIFYGNSENSKAGVSDTDSLVKFDTYGFSEETILRSDLAPQELYFRVGLPEGASLVQAQGEASSLQMVAAGQTIATIAAPSGRDAEGTMVPVTLSISGDMVTLNVEHQPGQYKLPIEVDPTTLDTQVLAIHNGVTYQSRWKVDTSNGHEGPFYFSEGVSFGIRDYHGENTSPAYAAGEWGGFQYMTQGESAIYDVHVTSSLSDGGHGFEARSQLNNLVVTGKNEPMVSHLDSYSEGSWPGWELCMLSGCAIPTEVTPEIAGNYYTLLQLATRPGNYTMNAELWGAWVYIVQTKNSTVGFDTADPEIATVPNALYGTEHWVRGAAGVVKGIAKDPGIGISELGFSSVNESKWGLSEPFMYPNTALCQGVVCPQEETHTINLTGLPDGKDTVTFAGQNATDTKALAAKVSATVYVDNTAPHNVVLAGLPTSNEVGGGEYKLTAEATDGTSPTPSSGMKSMALLVDGKEVGSLTTPCSPGPCTAHSGTWTIFGHNYATGRHTVTIQATDNAGNVTNELFVMIVHPASPVSMGPGTVNPLSGEMSLTATDASLGGLTASRSYGSQHLTAGENGPVSAQWGFSLGGQESLVRQIDGSLVLVDASGGQTIFPSDGKGGYVSPAGDSNLTLSSTPCEAGQTEFMLKNAAAATSTCFKSPTGGNSEILMPSITKSAVATETVTYAFERAEPHQARHEYSLPTGSEPFGVTTGPDGNMWFTDEGTSKVGKTTTSGTITEYALPAGSEPHGIVTGPDTNLWFAARGTSKIGKITTAGSITEYALPTKSWPEGIVGGPDGNLWFTESGTGKIGKITTAGAITEYALAVGSKPAGITAGPDGNLWFSNFNNSTLAKTVGKIATTGGTATEYSITGYAQGVVSGPDGNVWYANPSTNKIGKMTTAGVPTEYALPEKSQPEWLTVGPEGKLWFTDHFTSKVGSITTAGTVVEYTAGTNSGPDGIVTGPDKNLWFAEETTGKIAMLAPPEAGAKPIIEPTEALAPVPAGVSCSPELKPGCRALTFNYAESTTATGEEQNQWGDYNGHLTRIYYTVYDPVSKTMKTVEVAHYLYDKKARLRSEWDPRISPALKTVYGYDAEGHLTSLSGPGQETWAFTYGTMPGDNSGGRALKALQAPASTALWNGEGLTGTAAPSISGSSVLGNRMTTSDGAWSGKPVAYGYQWEDCNSVGAECTPIAGATNANYTPVSGDVGHTVVAQVTATNGSGSLVAVSAPSAPVTSTAAGGPPSYTQAVDSGNSINAVACVPSTTDCVVSDSAGKAFYATNVSASASATWNSWSGPGTSPSEALACPTTSLCVMAAGNKEGYGGNIYYATSLGGAWTNASSPTYGADAFSCVSASFCVEGQDNFGYFRYATTPASTTWTLESQGSAPMKGVNCLSTSFCAIADGAGNVHVAISNTQIESSGWTETKVDGTTALNGVACTSTTSCVAVDGAGNVINLAISGLGAATATKHNIDSTHSLNAVTCPTSSICVTVDDRGSVFTSLNAGETWAETLQLGEKLTSVSCSSATLCVTVDTTGHVTSFNPSLTQTVDSGNSINAVACVPSTTDCVITDSVGKAFYSTNVSTAGASWTSWAGPGTSPSEAVACPSTGVCLMAAGSLNGYGGSLYYATSFGGSWTLGYTPSYGVDAISCASSSFCIDGQDNGGFFRYATNPASTSWTLESQGSAAMKGTTCLSSSFCAITDSAGNVHVATTTTQIESSSWTSTNVDGTTALNGVACTSTSSCVAVDGAGNIINLAIAGGGAATATKHNIDSTNSLTAVTCPSSSTCVAVDDHGNIFDSTNAGGTWTQTYQLGGKLTSVACASTSLCVTADATGNVTTFNPAGGVVHEGEARSPQPGTTAEYNVPLSGTGLPNLTSGEVEKWAQTDKPTEATAIFPPDEAQGWPSTGYKRATIYYRDSTSRPVNVANPGGAISTSEYNEHNDVVRSLNADNRATALKEASPAAASKLLDTQSEYNSEGTELLSTVGPRHAAKLANGTEVQARSHTVYHYDEGAPAEGGPYRLVTKTTQGAQIEGEAEQDIRTTTTLYSGQNNLGWTLRKPTAVIADPSGLKLTHRTVYDPGTGNVVETRTPGASGPLPYLRYQSSWGTTGQPPIDRAEGVAIDKEGNIWVADTENNRIVELWSNGTLRRTVGSVGTGNAQFTKPAAIATDSTGNVWVADTGNSRVQELSSVGTYLRQVGKYGTGNGEFKSPRGITVDSTGHVWVADTGNNRVQEFTSEAAYMTQYGSQGTGNGQFNQPYSVAVDKEANIWIGDSANGRIQELSSTGTYIRQFGREGNTKPCKEEFGTIVCENWWAEGLTIDATGHIWEAEAGKVEEFSSTGTAITHFGTFGHGEGQFEYAKGIALDSESHVWIADSGNTRIQEVSSTGAYIRQYPATPIPLVLNNPKSFSRTGAGNWLLADTGNNRLQEATSGGSFSKQSFYQTNLIEGVGTDEKGAIWFSSQSGGSSMIVRESSTMGPEWATTSFVGAGEGGNFNQPAGIAFAGEKMYVADRGNNRIIEGEKGSYVRRFGTVGSGNGQLSKPQGLALDSKGNVWVADTGNNRVEEFTGEGAYVAAYGTVGTGNGQFSKPQGVAVDNEGNVWVADTGNNRVEVLSSTGVYIQQFGTVGAGSGQMKEPTDVTTDTAHHVYVLDAGNGRVQTWLNEGESEYAPSPHGALTVYYTTASNSKYPSCGGHPEWAKLTCESLPSAQPETPGVPNLPVTTATYNMYDEPTVATGSSGTGTRTTTLTYDEAGRNIGSETTSNVGEALPKVNDKYGATTGELTEQYTSTQSLKSVFNTIGQLTSYTDADGNVTTYEYENGGDTRLTHINDGKGTQSYTYDTTTGAFKELVDSAAGTFTAVYDVEGNLIGELYPNAMTAIFTLNATGEAVGSQYVKTAHCAKTCPETWYSDSVVPSIHGQWLSQQSNQGTQNYTYDQVGRLAQAQITPTGKGCVTRIYGYDEETNRASITTRPPGTGGACSNEGGTVENHSYDAGNRLTDVGTSYDSFGNTAKLSASDAGGTELNSSFYQDNQLQSQVQNGQTIGYHLDPASRDREAVSTGTVTATEVQHYSGPTTKTPSWTGELSSNYTRYITGLSGMLVAIQHNGETPKLQLANLHGDLVATASDSESATELTSTVGEASEYGVPATEAPSKYSWLGTHEVPTTLPSGTNAMGTRSYVPQLGRYLQTDPIPGGSANAYAYVAGDPVNTTDLSGAYTWGFGASARETLNAQGAQVAQAYEALVRAEAELLAEAAAAEAAMYAAFEAAGPEEEWGEEEGEEEYAVWDPKAGAEHEAAAGDGLLFRPVGDGMNQSQTEDFVVPACNGAKPALPCGRRVLRFHWHWWGVSIALSRKDMQHLSDATAAIGLILAKKAPTIASALGITSLSASLLSQVNLCMTVWFAWVPGKHGQVTNGLWSAGIYKCYG